MREHFRIGKQTLYLLGAIVALTAVFLVFINVHIPNERKLLQQVELMESVYGADSQELFGPLSLLAIVYQISERYDKAEGIYERMLLLDKKYNGLESEVTRGTLLAIANMADLQGNYKHGDSLYAEALKIDKILEKKSLLELQDLKKRPKSKLSPEQKKMLKLDTPYQSDLAQALNQKIKAYRQEGRQELARHLEQRKQALGL